jgi:hypothetical protein
MPWTVDIASVINGLSGCMFFWLVLRQLLLEDLRLVMLLMVLSLTKYQKQNIAL